MLSLARRARGGLRSGAYFGFRGVSGGREEKRISRVALSGSGWLLPFHIGACQAMKELELVDEKTEYCGASGGSLIATGAVLDIPTDKMMEYVLDLAKWYRSEGGFGKLENELRKRFKDILPPNATDSLNGRLHVSVLPLTPQNRLNQRIISSFESDSDLLDALITSSFIPLYLGPSFATKFRDEWCVDGGLGNIVPRFEGAITVCPIPFTGPKVHPAHPMRLVAKNVNISPDNVRSFGNLGKETGSDADEVETSFNSEKMTAGGMEIPSLSKMLMHCFVPEDEQSLRNYFELGVESVKIWAKDPTAPSQ